jgi:hypothetical protein
LSDSVTEIAPVAGYPPSHFFFQLWEHRPSTGTIDGVTLMAAPDTTVDQLREQYVTGIKYQTDSLFVS